MYSLFSQIMKDKSFVNIFSLPVADAKNFSIFE